MIQSGWASTRCIISGWQSAGYLLTVCVSHAIPAVMSGTTVFMLWAVHQRFRGRRRDDPQP